MRYFIIFVLAAYFVRCDVSSNYYVIEIPEDEMKIPPKTKQFDVYWNVPTIECKKRGVIFSNLFEKYGIIQNQNDLFRGEKIAILYDPGNFPALIKNETTGKFKFRNGGVPQEGDMESHLKEFRSSLDQSIPDPDFEGIGIIDFESWRPIFRQNFGVLEPYKDISYELERKRHWWWLQEWVRTEAKSRFEESARKYMKNTIALAKEMRPKAKWGYYGFPPCFNKPAYNNDNCAKGVPEENDKLDWLWSESSALYPSVYSSKAFETNQLAQFIRSKVSEAARKAHKHVNIILPYFWYRYRDGGYFTPKDLKLALQVLYRSNASGIIIWGSSYDINSTAKCESLLEYINTTLGPAIMKYAKQDKRNELYDEEFDFDILNDDPKNTSVPLMYSNDNKPNHNITNESVNKTDSNVNVEFIEIFRNKSHNHTNKNYTHVSNNSTNENKTDNSSNVEFIEIFRTHLNNHTNNNYTQTINNTISENKTDYKVVILPLIPSDAVIEIYRDNHHRHRSIIPSKDKKKGIRHSSSKINNLNNAASQDTHINLEPDYESKMNVSNKNKTSEVLITKDAKKGYPLHSALNHRTLKEITTKRNKAIAVHSLTNETNSEMVNTTPYKIDTDASNTLTTKDSDIFNITPIVLLLNDSKSIFDFSTSTESSTVSNTYKTTPTDINPDIFFESLFETNNTKFDEIFLETESTTRTQNKNEIISTITNTESTILTTDVFEEDIIEIKEDITTTEKYYIIKDNTTENAETKLNLSETTEPTTNIPLANIIKRLSKNDKKGIRRDRFYRSDQNFNILKTEITSDLKDLENKDQPHVPSKSPKLESIGRNKYIFCLFFYFYSFAKCFCEIFNEC